MPHKDHSLLLAWLPALLWLTVIAWESLLLSSSETSRYFIPLVHFLLPSLSFEQLTLLHAMARKAGHFVGYALLGLFFFRGCWASLFEREARAASSAQSGEMQIPRAHLRTPGWKPTLKLWSARAALLAVLATATVASLDEMHQSTEHGRTGAVYDVILDTSGAVFVVLTLLAVCKGRLRSVAFTYRDSQALANKVVEKALANLPDQRNSGRPPNPLQI